jgi:hypothetical protein
MTKPKLPTLVPIQIEPTKVLTTSAATPKQKPSKAPPVASPDEFIQLGNNRGGNNWNVAQVNKPAPILLQKKKFVAVTVAPEVVAPVPTPVVIPITEPQLPLQVPSPSGTPVPLLEDDLTAQNLYKTELCRSFEETGNCRYGTKCQFAHGRPELRPVMRHPKYKTEVCKTFHTVGTCPYGKRCRFIHTRAELPAPTAAVVPATPVAAPVAVQAVPVALPVALIDTKDWTSSWTASKPTNESQRVMVKPISKHNAIVPVVTQKAAGIVFPVQETKTVEQFMPATAPIFLPSFPVRDFTELPQQLPIKEAIITAVTEAPVFSTAVVPVEAAAPSAVVAPISSPTLEEDEDEEDAVSRGLGSRLSIFAQICSNDE